MAILSVISSSDFANAHLSGNFSGFVLAVFALQLNVLAGFALQLIVLALFSLQLIVLAVFAMQLIVLAVFGAFSFFITFCMYLNAKQ